MNGLEEDHLLKQALFTSIDHHSCNKWSWYSNIVYILKFIDVDIETFDVE